MKRYIQWLLITQSERPTYYRNHINQPNIYILCKLSVQRMNEARKGSNGILYAHYTCTALPYCSIEIIIDCDVYEIGICIYSKAIILWSAWIQSITLVIIFNPSTSKDCQLVNIKRLSTHETYSNSFIRFMN